MGKHKNKRNSKFASRVSKEDNKISGKVDVKSKFAAVAKSKALQRRKNTILEEYKHHNKRSYIKDKRLDSAGGRYAALKAKSYKNDFNFGLSSENLTHGGRTLNEIENFEEVGSEDDENEVLDANFVKNVHFGGGILSESKRKSETSYKDLIDQLIFESKRKKEEQKKTKEETSELTKDLDSKLQPLMSLFSNNSNPVQSKELDEYDNKMKQLQLGRYKPVERPETQLQQIRKTAESLPSTYNDFQNILLEKSYENRGAIIKDIVSTCPKDRRQVCTLFVYLLQYVDFMAETAEKEMRIENTFIGLYKVIINCLFELAPLVTDMHMVVEKIILDKHNIYKENANVFPGLDILVFLKTMSCLFSNSNSTIGSVCVAFIDQMLTKCDIKTLKDVSYGLFLVSTVLQYGKSSEGFLPSAFSFLNHVLYMAIPQDKKGDILKEISSPVDLVLAEKIKISNKKPIECLSVSYLLGDASLSNLYKLQILKTTLSLFKDIIKHIEGFPCEIELLESFCKLLELLPLKNYPKEIKNSSSVFINILEEKENSRKLQYLIQEKKKPQALRLYEPNIQKVYEYKKTRGTSKGDSERTVLVRKLKKEKKGAIRELRRDRMFLTKVKIDGKLQSDKERYSKVKRIFSEGNTQQAELNVLKRKKGKK